MLTQKQSLDQPFLTLTLGLQAAATLEHNIRTEIEETSAATAAMQAAVSRADAMLQKLAEQSTPLVSLCQPQLRSSCLLQHSSGQPCLYKMRVVIVVPVWGMLVSTHSWCCHRRSEWGPARSTGSCKTCW